MGLSVEATLPLPQLYSNFQARSCKGFRTSVLASWLAGDFMKMFWFFTATTQIPWAFKLCGIFQMFCDVGLGLQYWVYGNGPKSTRPNMEKDHGHTYDSGLRPHEFRIPSRSGTPFGEKEGRLE
jgi:hypothetical protein